MSGCVWWYALPSRYWGVPTNQHFSTHHLPTRMVRESRCSTLFCVAGLEGTLHHDYRFSRPGMTA